MICLQECDSFHEILASLQEDKANRVCESGGRRGGAGHCFRGLDTPRRHCHRRGAYPEMSHKSVLPSRVRRFFGRLDGVVSTFVVLGIGFFRTTVEPRLRPSRARKLSRSITLFSPQALCPYTAGPESLSDFIGHFPVRKRTFFGKGNHVRA